MRAIIFWVAITGQEKSVLFNYMKTSFSAGRKSDTTGIKKCVFSENFTASSGESIYTFSPNPTSIFFANTRLNQGFQGHFLGRQYN